MNLEEVKRLENEGKFKECAKCFLDEYNDGGEDWYTIKAGELLYKAGDIKGATKAYENAFDSNLEVLHDKVFDFYFLTKQFSRASKMFFETQINISKKKMISFADRLFKVKAFSEAEYWYRNAITKTVDIPSYHFISYNAEDYTKYNGFQIKKINKAFEYFDLGEYQKALAIFRRFTDDYKLQIKTAECFFMLRDFEKAREIYRGIVQRTNDSYCMFMLGECYNNEDLEVNSFENAFYWYQYAEQEKSPYPYYNLGLCYQFGRGVEENIDKAKEMFTKGVESKIDDDKCLCKLGFLEYNEGNTQKAIEYYERAIEKGNSIALYNVAVCYFEDKIYFCSEDEIICYLAKSAALGNKKALVMLRNYDLVNCKE